VHVASLDEPTLEQRAQWLAIRDHLSPREAMIGDAVIARMTPELRAQWLAELSALTVAQAADVVRSLVSQARRSAKDPNAKAPSRSRREG
jgi:hypothetical protein